MNYRKLDASLAMTVNQVSDPQEANLVIFIHTQQPLNEDASVFLQRLGINNITENSNVFTATVSLNAIAELSEQSWVESLKLSQKLHLVRKN
jgi:hypothetical protein